jgi:alanine-glyoxylate transaminase/serine-glyoxylate transaminase/serine-pyruvate transaminase
VFTPTRRSGISFLHSPGPTPIPKEVTDAMGRQPMELGDPGVDALIAACEKNLRPVLGLETGDVFMFNSNGHGGWEATIANLVAPGQCVLIAGSGTFSDGWAEHAEALGARVIRTHWESGMPADPQAVDAALRADTAHEIVALFLVHTDTASGVTNDIKAFRAALDATGHPALLVVDVVASLAAAPFSMDEMGVNVAIGASQKALMVASGLAIVGVDARAMDVARRNPTPRYYWDWERRREPMSYRKFCGTPPQALLMGLEASLGLIHREGLTEVLARHRRLAGAVQAAVARWSDGGALDFFVKVPEARSVSVTTVTVTPDINSEALRTLARDRFQVGIAGGLGYLAGKAFRIGHLGDINAPTVLGCLAGLEAALSYAGIPYGRGGVDAAVRALSLASE